MIKYRIGATPLLSEWLELIWESALVRQQILRMAKTTAGILKISQDDIRRIWLPIPPKVEMVEAIALFTGFAQPEGEVSAALAQAGKEQILLRQSILKAAFEGRLVPQDPTDEAASVLLARLRDGNHQMATRRRRARAKEPFSHPSLPGLTRQSLDPRVEPAGDD